MDSARAETASTPSLTRLFLSFPRLGTTAFAGPVMVAYIRKMAVERERLPDDATYVPSFDRLRASDYFNRCVSGILASFVGLLLSVTIQSGLGVPWDVPRIMLAGAAPVALVLRVDILWVVLARIAAALVLSQQRPEGPHVYELSQQGNKQTGGFLGQ